ncbi:MAG: hypothetical protein H6719_05530 [Sandaracinaceae bacterium]|nr:hypothetical protein [Sandaracinaceae bacterium]
MTEPQSDISRRAGTPLARQAGASVSVYAAVTGLAGAVPVPMLDSVLSELSRGAAMRRVAKRHGVVLTPDARGILSSPGSIHATSTERGRLVKAALSSILAPFRIAARVEDAFGTLFAAVCLDHFLRRPDRPARAALTAAEARRVRSATERAIGEAGFDALKTIPAGLWQILRRAFDALVNADEEGRSPIERFVDAVLDGFADAPDDLVDALTLQFDLALEQETGTP